jgi:hypothetical protein
VGLTERLKLINTLSPPIDHLLCTQLVDEFISSEKRYIQRDWEPSQLDGGQFAEIAARILYEKDSSNLNRTKDFNGCAQYIENEQVTHWISPRADALHIVRVLRTIYKFRSQRGAVHISPTYTPNHMDSRLVIECVRWVMSEILRIFWNGDREAVAKVIREIIQFDVPVIGIFDQRVLVQRTDLTPDEEILILLHYAGEEGFSRTSLGKWAMLDPSKVTRSLQKLAAPSCRQIVQVSNGSYRLTDLGSRRIRNELSDKLTA